MSVCQTAHYSPCVNTFKPLPHGHVEAVALATHFVTYGQTKGKVEVGKRLCMMQQRWPQARQSEDIVIQRVQCSEHGELRVAPLLALSLSTQK